VHRDRLNVFLEAEEKSQKLKWRTQIQKQKKGFEDGNHRRVKRIEAKRKEEKAKEAKKKERAKKKHQDSTETWLASSPAMRAPEETIAMKSRRQEKLEMLKSCRKAVYIAKKAAKRVKEMVKCLKEILKLVVSNRELLMPHLGKGSKFGIPLTFDGLTTLRKRLDAQEERRLNKELREHKARTEELAERARVRKDHIKKKIVKAKWYLGAIKVQRFVRRIQQKNKNGREMRLKLYTQVIPGVLRIQRHFRRVKRERLETARAIGLDLEAAEAKAKADKHSPHANAQ
jgi:hypothetical protein